MTSITQTATDHTFAPDRSWTQAIFKTDGSATQALLRLTLAFVLLPHGAQHLLGWFGGYGFTATVNWMNTAVGIPVPAAVAGILIEFFGPLLLIAGLASRLTAFSLAVFMAVAGSTHLQNGFFMNWFGTLPAGAEGFEYHLLVMGMAAAVAIGGSGAASVDRVITRESGDRAARRHTVS